MKKIKLGFYIAKLNFVFVNLFMTFVHYFGKRKQTLWSLLQEKPYKTMERRIQMRSTRSIRGICGQSWRIGQILMT